MINRNKTKESLKSLKLQKNASRYMQVYLRLIETEQMPPTVSQTKWIHDLDIQNSNDISWRVVYRLPFDTTIETKLINF